MAAAGELRAKPIDPVMGPWPKSYIWVH